MPHSLFVKDDPAPTPVEALLRNRGNLAHLDTTCQAPVAGCGDLRCVQGCLRTGRRRLRVTPDPASVSVQPAHRYLTEGICGVIFFAGQFRRGLSRQGCRCGFLALEAIEHDRVRAASEPSRPTRRSAPTATWCSAPRVPPPCVNFCRARECRPTSTSFESCRPRIRTQGRSPAYRQVKPLPVQPSRLDRLRCRLPRQPRLLRPLRTCRRMRAPQPRARQRLVLPQRRPSRKTVKVPTLD